MLVDVKVKFRDNQHPRPSSPGFAGRCAVVNYAETKYGFYWGAAKVTRCFSDAKKGWVVLLVETPKHKKGNALQIYVTKSGKIRIHDARGEWNPPNI